MGLTSTRIDRIGRQYAQLAFKYTQRVFDVVDNEGGQFGIHSQIFF